MDGVLRSMDMNVQNLAIRFSKAAAVLAAKEQYLSSVDAETGDGDHGVTIAKIANAIMTACEQCNPNAAIGQLFDACYVEIMKVNGGSAGPLWAEMFSGMSEAAGDASELDGALLRRLYRGAVDGLNEISNAKPGEKTMKDALLPAAEAAERCEGSCGEIARAAAEAAERGAEKTRDMVAKFGRARYLKEDSIGHLDPGAVSVSIMLRALAD